jgi:hypothetical protein
MPEPTKAQPVAPAPMRIMGVAAALRCAADSLASIKADNQFSERELMVIDGCNELTRKVASTLADLAVALSGGDRAQLAKLLLPSDN